MIIKPNIPLFRTEKRPSHAPTKAYDEQQKMIADNRVLLTVLKDILKQMRFNLGLRC
jgi:hypothetical protein